MIKIIPPGSQVFDDPVVQVVKMASSGLRGHDLKQFIKRAGHELADMVRRLEVKPGELPIHMLAIGSTEWFGANRNGDGFKEAVCKRYHPTFVKHARYYYNHANKNPKKSYGIVKLSHYNGDMHRIELIVGLNATKEAADRNGGLVAEPTLEKLGRGDPIGVSMACAVPYDLCSICGNRARNRDEYCRGEAEGGDCPGGGLYTKIGTVLDDGRQVYADNTEPRYIDISEVVKPADRIAYATGVVDPASFAKLASANLGGAAMAEALGITGPPVVGVTDPYTFRVAAVLEKLASVELAVASAPASAWNYAFADVVQPAFDWAGHQSALPAVLRALAMEKVAMPLAGFIEAVTGKPADAAITAGVSARLPGVYGRLLHGDDEKIAEEVACYSSGRAVTPVALRKWAAEATDYSLDRRAVESRVRRASLYGKPPVSRPVSLVKAASAYDGLARTYALYKVAFLVDLQSGLQNRLQSFAGDAFDLTCELAVRQNCL